MGEVQEPVRDDGDELSETKIYIILTLLDKNTAKNILYGRTEMRRLHAYLMMMMMELGGLVRIVAGAELEYMSERGDEEEQQF